MGGQACVFYGAAEFSRDCDIVIVANDENLARLTSALAELQADCIAEPPLDWTYLSRGHALHFRCKHPDALNIRIDVMTRMRGCDDFDQLWSRRTTLQDADGCVYELLGIEDLVLAKKTQRDKDWPMIRRLLDAHFDEFGSEPTTERVRFWLRESRSPSVLISLAEKNAEDCLEMISVRPLLSQAVSGSESALQRELDREQSAEKEADQAYWDPLKKELEAMRLSRRKKR